jgi:hypothetical protein
MSAIVPALAHPRVGVARRAYGAGAQPVFAGRRPGIERAARRAPRGTRRALRVSRAVLFLDDHVGFEDAPDEVFGADPFGKRAFFEELRGGGFEGAPARSRRLVAVRVTVADRV